MPADYRGELRKSGAVLRALGFVASVLLVVFSATLVWALLVRNTPAIVLAAILIVVCVAGLYFMRLILRELPDLNRELTEYEKRLRGPNDDDEVN